MVGSFSCSRQILNCGQWDLVPCPGMAGPLPRECEVLATEPPVKFPVFFNQLHGGPTLAPLNVTPLLPLESRQWPGLPLRQLRTGLLH